MPFIREGFAAGDRAVHIVDRGEARPPRPDAVGGGHRRRAEPGDAPTGSAQVGRGVSARRLFDQDAMLALIQEVLEEGRRQKFPMTRLVANMEWALEDRPGVARHRRIRIPPELHPPKYDDTVVCTYNLGKFSASAVMDILRTHPMVDRRRGDAGESVLYAARRAAPRAGGATAAARRLESR